MNVLFIFRKKTSHQFSIEKVFSNIISVLKTKEELNILKYQSNGFKSILFDSNKINNYKADVNIITGDCNFLVPLVKNKVVLVVHDAGHYEYTLKGIKKYIYGLIWWRIPLKYANLIICVSENTKKSLNRLFQIDLKQIEVVENPVDNNFFKIKVKRISEIPRILQIGTGPHKNLCNLIKSISGLNCILNVVGQLSYNQIQLLKTNNINYNSYSNLKFKEILRLYENSDIVTVISFGEGFGLPIIEAQSSSRALITSNIEPMKTISGEFACKIDPYCIKSIRNGIMKLINDENYRFKIIDEGKINSLKYRVEDVANKYLNIILNL